MSKAEVCVLMESVEIVIPWCWAWACLSTMRWELVEFGSSKDSISLWHVLEGNKVPDIIIRMVGVSDRGGGWCSGGRGRRIVKIVS
jgi:hypothetical protein